MDMDRIRPQTKNSVRFSLLWISSYVIAVIVGCAKSDSFHRIKRRDAAGDGWQPPTAPVDWEATAQQMLQQILSSKANENVARNVIFFLGDGMGVATVTAGRIYSGQLKGQPGEENQLTFEKFPDVALVKTYNVDYQVPDSAGTATAFLCGVKANMGVIGVNQKVRRGVCADMTRDTPTNNSVDSILRWSIREGKRTGIVTTTRVTHATPSSAYAHSVDRGWESDGQVPADVRYGSLCDDIASQLITANSDINVVMGGGRKHFLPANGSSPNNGTRLDGRNLIEEWKLRQLDKAAVYVSNKNDFMNVDPTSTDYLLGLFNADHMQYRIMPQESGSPEPSLADMTEKAIKVLRRGNKGYFLLVEGGRIDHGHHAATAKVALEEVVGFDEAIQRAVSITDQSDTLIVVTADHSHVVAIGGYPSRGNPLLGTVDARGYLEEPALDQMPYLTVMYTNGPGIVNRTNLTGIDTQSNWFKQPVNVPLAAETHGGEDVAVYATGPMSHLFKGVMEQNYIAHAMAYASCVGINKAHCTSGTAKSAASGSCTGFSSSRNNSLQQYFVSSSVFVITAVYTKLLLSADRWVSS